MALVAYRNILRSIPIAFRGDGAMLAGARQQARQLFEDGRKLSDSEKITEGIQHAKDVAKILRQNVVQGQPNGEDQYRLRIHEETERGDNDTVKVAGQKLKQVPASKH